MNRKRERGSESCSSRTEDGEEVRGKDMSSEEDDSDCDSDGSSIMLSEQVGACCYVWWAWDYD